MAKHTKNCLVHVHDKLQHYHTYVYILFLLDNSLKEEHFIRSCLIYSYKYHIKVA